MTTVLIIIMMVGIGAVIGGVTNSLAIKMLFRPYHEKYIGKFRLPFTPGLIPKRKDELAKQLGKLVVEHLITEEGLRKKIVHVDFQNQVEAWLRKEVNNIVLSDNTARTIIHKFDFSVDEIQMKQGLQEKTKKYYHQWMEQHKTKTISELIDKNIEEKVVSYFPMIAEQLQQKGSEYLTTENATNKMQALVDSYFTDKGFFGNMFASVLGGKTIVDKVQPILINYVTSQDAQVELEKIVHQEWQIFLQKTVEEVEESIGIFTFDSLIDYVIDRYLPTAELLDKPFKAWFAPITDVVDHLVTIITSQLLQAVENRVGKLIGGLGLEQIVEKEVQAFPLDRVEQLVQNISRKELKLITYLGALLGGLIGLIQGIIVVLVG